MISISLGKVLVTCLPPVSTEGLTTEDVNDLTERVQRMMLDTYLKTTAEVELEAERNGTSILPPKYLKNIDKLQKEDTLSNVETFGAECKVTAKIKDIEKVTEMAEDILNVPEKDIMDKPSLHDDDEEPETLSLAEDDTV